MVDRDPQATRAHVSRASCSRADRASTRGDRVCPSWQRQLTHEPLRQPWLCLPPRRHASPRALSHLDPQVREQDPDQGAEQRAARALPALVRRAPTPTPTHEGPGGHLLASRQQDRAMGFAGLTRYPSPDVRKGSCTRFRGLISAAPSTPAWARGPWTCPSTPS